LSYKSLPNLLQDNLKKINHSITYNKNGAFLNRDFHLKNLLTKIFAAFRKFWAIFASKNVRLNGEISHNLVTLLATEHYLEHLLEIPLTLDEVLKNGALRHGPLQRAFREGFDPHFVIEAFVTVTR
jgi:hypothetical protein